MMYNLKDIYIYIYTHNFTLHMKRSLNKNIKYKKNSFNYYKYKKLCIFFSNLHRILIDL